jgi:hypothetical protein
MNCPTLRRHSASHARPETSEIVTMRHLLAALILFAAPAAAQQLSDPFDVIGEMSVTLDGTAMVLPIAVDTERGESYATIKEFFGRKVLSVMAVTPVEVGGWDAPMVILTIQLGNGGQGRLQSIELIEKGRSPSQSIEAGGGNGSKDMTNFSIAEDGAVELSFSGELIRLVVDAEYNQKPEEGQPPVVMSGTVSMLIPQAFRVQ